MRLQLRASDTERRVCFHVSHRGVRFKHDLDVVIKVRAEIDLAGIAMRVSIHLRQIGVAIG